MTLDLCASTRDWIARSPSRQEIEDFAGWLKAERYTDFVRDRHLRRLLLLLPRLSRDGGCRTYSDAQLDRVFGAERFPQSRLDRFAASRRVYRRFLIARDRFREDQGSDRFAPLRRDYARYLIELRGLSRSSRVHHAQEVADFLARGLRPRQQLRSLCRADIERFIQIRSQETSRHSMQHTVEILRSFLRYIHHAGLIPGRPCTASRRSALAQWSRSRWMVVALTISLRYISYGCMATRSPQGRYLLLGLLDLEDQSGYDLKQAIEQSVGHFWREGYGQIYPALEQLEQAGLVESHVERQSGRPDRKVYTLLEMGRERLREWLKEPARDEVPRNELLLKLFFGRLMSKATLRAHLTSKRDRLLEELRVYRALHARLDHESARRKELPYWLLTLRYGVHITKAELAWCNEALKQFDGEIT